MRKRLLITVIAVATLAAGGWSGWQTRHLWLAAAINLWLTDGKVQKINNIAFYQGQLRAQGILFQLDGGTLLQLADLQLDHPLGLLKLGRHGASLRIQKLSILPLADSASTDHEPSMTPPPDLETEKPEKMKKVDGTEYPELYISQLLEWQRDLQLDELKIDQLVWPGTLPIAGVLEVNHTDSQLNGNFYTENHSIHWQLKQQVDSFSLEAELRSKNQQVLADFHIKAASKTGSAEMKTPRFWKTTIVLNLNLEPGHNPGNHSPDTLLSLLNTIQAAKPNSLAQFDLNNIEGQLNAKINLILPDQLNAWAYYRNIEATISSRLLQVGFQAPIFSTPQIVSLTIDNPIKIRIDQVQPLQLKTLLGKLNIKLQTITEGQARAWFSTKLTATTTAGKTHIDSEGALNLSAVEAALNRQQWQKFFSPYQLSGIKGLLPFKVNLVLPGLKNIQPYNELTFHNLEIELLKNGTVSFQLKDNNGSKNPLPIAPLNNSRVLIKLSSPTTLKAKKWPGKFNINAKLIDIWVEDFKKKPIATIQANSIRCQDLPDILCSTDVTVAIPSLSLQEDNITIKKYYTKSSVNIETINNNLTLSLPQIDMTANQININTLKVNDLDLISRNAKCVNESDNIHCLLPKINIGFTPITLNNLQVNGILNLSEIKISQQKSHQNDQWQLSGNYLSNTLEISLIDQFKSKISSEGDFFLKNGIATGTSNFQVAHVKLGSQWQHRLDDHNGWIKAAMKETKFSPQKPLTLTIQGVPLELASGSLAASSKLSWPASDSDTLSLTMRSLAAAYQDVFAIGVDSQLLLENHNNQWITPNPQPIKIQQLDLGIPLKNLSFYFSLDKKQDLSITQLSGELLDGRISSNKLTWNLSGEERKSTVRLDGLSLEALAVEMDSKEFAATGLLDAQLPLITTGNGATVQQGHLKARKPGGLLRYYGAFSAETLSSNPQLKLISGALEDYNYRDMSGTIEYPLSGDLRLRLKLIGHSSAVDKNRDLIINLNLENNIPTMLKSLQASRNLTDLLDKQLH